eukprot:Clim_evm9s108 gene=Clim_evmTU9s108
MTDILRDNRPQPIALPPSRRTLSEDCLSERKMSLPIGPTTRLGRNKSGRALSTPEIFRGTPGSRIGVRPSWSPTRRGSGSPIDTLEVRTGYLDKPHEDSLSLYESDTGSQTSIESGLSHEQLASIIRLSNASYEQADKLSKDLLRAASKGDLDAVYWSLEHPLVEINCCTQSGVTPLMYACMYNHIDVVEVLLQNGASTLNGCGFPRNAVDLSREYADEDVLLMVEEAHKKEARGSDSSRGDSTRRTFLKVDKVTGLEIEAQDSGRPLLERQISTNMDPSKRYVRSTKFFDITVRNPRTVGNLPWTMHTQYEISVDVKGHSLDSAASNSKHSFVITRRYREFARLWEKIEAKLAECDANDLVNEDALPALPPRKLLSRFSSAVVDLRMNAFTEVLTWAANHSELFELVIEFLNIEVSYA